MHIVPCIKAITLGVADGWKQPYDLTSGMTWNDPDLNEIYDRSVNVGQAARIGYLSVRVLYALGRHPIE